MTPKTYTLAELRNLPENHLTREDLFDLLEGYENAVADMMETVYNACNSRPMDEVADCAVHEVDQAVEMYVGSLRQEGVKWVVDYSVTLPPKHS